MAATSIPWLSLQLADSAFPTGGFAHSAGLEAAVQHRAVTDAAGVRRFLAEALGAASDGALPLVRAAHEDSARLERLDARCEAMLTNHVANRASRAQGRALIDTCARIFGAGDGALGGRVHAISAACGALHRHHAPIFGATLAALEVDREACAQLFLHLVVRSVTSAAVRLGVVGPHEAQRLQHGVAPMLDRLLATSARLEVDDCAQTSPIADLRQATHDRLYSRLFQS